MTWDLSTPPGTENIRQGDDRIRELKVDIQTALQAEGVFPGPAPASPIYRYAPPRGTTAGRPASSASTAGRLYINTDTNSIERDRGDGINWDAVASLEPPGAVKQWAGNAAPGGYLLCDGSAVARATYAALFSAIGISHGQGDGVTTFNVPDYRGRFLRGRDRGTGTDPDAGSRTAMAAGGNTGDAVGSIQGQATRKNGLTLNDPVHNHAERVANAGSGALGVQSATGIAATLDTTLNVVGASTGVTLNNGDNETRPVNAYVEFIIKT